MRRESSECMGALSTVLRTESVSPFGISPAWASEFATAFILRRVAPLGDASDAVELRATSMGGANQDRSTGARRLRELGGGVRSDGGLVFPGHGVRNSTSDRLIPTQSARGIPRHSAACPDQSNISWTGTSVIVPRLGPLALETPSAATLAPMD